MTTVLTFSLSPLRCRIPWCVKIKRGAAENAVNAGEIHETKHSLVVLMASINRTKDSRKYQAVLCEAQQLPRGLIL